MKNNLLINTVLSISVVLLSNFSYSSETIPLKSSFDRNEVSWVREKGTASIEGEAFIKLEDGTYKGCSGFNVELLPVGSYSSERIYKTYGNNKSGQILLSESPPKFTPDAEEYHKFVLKSKCDENNRFSFSDVHPGEYYVMAFIIWDGDKGGGVMKRASLISGIETTTVLKAD